MVLGSSSVVLVVTDFLYFLYFFVFCLDAGAALRRRGRDALGAQVGGWVVAGPDNTRYPAHNKKYRSNHLAPKVTMAKIEE